MKDFDFGKFLDDAIKAGGLIDTYVLEIGVNYGVKDRKKSKGVTNADLMAIHEYGAPKAGIPPRPVLQMTVDWTDKTILAEIAEKAIMSFFTTGSEIEMIRTLEKQALRVQSHARQIIYNNDGALVANKPAVAKRKGGNHPLFDTGQLARSITCKVDKK